MNSLRFLLVHRSPAHSEEILALLTRANHSVLPASGLEEAADALTLERFDAILLDAELSVGGLNEFSAQLRRLEEGQRSPVRVPIIGLTPSSATVAAEIAQNDSCLDAVLPEPIDAETLTAAVSQLAHAVAGANRRPCDGVDLPVIDPEKFREQVGFDDELMAEIIDIFLEERERQEPEMRDALVSGDFDLLCRIAHTIKGSLGSLHALRARSHAQDLEFGARDHDADVCWQSLAALETDLAELEPELRTLRQN